MIKQSDNIRQEISKEQWIVDLAIDYLQSYGKSQLETIKEEVPRIPSFEVNVSEMEQIYDAELEERGYMDFSELLHRKPYEVELAFKTAFMEIMDGHDKFSNIKARYIDVRFIGVDDESQWHMTIDGLKPQFEDEFVTVEGVISEMTQSEPKITFGMFNCRNCGETFGVRQPGENLYEPDDCPSGCGNDAFPVLKKRSSLKRPYSKIRIQQAPDEVDGNSDPSTVIGILVGDDVDDLVSGDRIKANGILRTEDSGDKSVLSKYLELNSVEDEESDSDIVVTEEEIEYFEEKLEKARNGEIETPEHIDDDTEIRTGLDIVAASTAPTIYGNWLEKRGVAAAMIKGVKKPMKGADSRRGDFHMLLIGDPGVGKSVILEFINDVCPYPSISTSGKGASSAGLTAGMVKSKDSFSNNDQMTLKAGALPIADQGIACVDEIDKMDESDRSSMHEALEQQQVSISKSGVQATLDCRVSLIAGANPKNSRWSEFEPVSDQIDLEAALLSRFDLIFVMKDEQDEEEDREIADAILDISEKGQRNAKLDEGEIEEEGEGIETPLSEEEVKKFIYYANTEFTPVLTPEAKRRIREKYVEIRGKNEEDSEAVPITARKLEGIVRVAEACARANFNDKITKEDANEAIDIIVKTMKRIGYNEETGEWDADLVAGDTSGSQRNRIKGIIELIETLEEDEEYYVEDKRGVKREDIIELAVEKVPGVDNERDAKDQIERLTFKGTIKEPTGGFFSVNR